MLSSNQVLGIFYVCKAHIGVHNSCLGPSYYCQITALERIQHRAPQPILCEVSTYDSITEVLTLLNWPSLEQRRNQLQAKRFLVYKILNKIVVCVDFYQ